MQGVGGQEERPTLPAEVLFSQVANGRDTYPT